ncbi:MAG: TonB-dependent receptor [Bacteroidales bacterium]|nr:TonB-dependent receptor [Bacteroidales bacterium]
MRKILLFFSMLLVTYTLNAQSSYGGGNFPGTKNGILTGKVKDMNSDKMVEYATIAVFNQLDSSLVGGTISLPDGSFTISGLPYGNLYLEASFIGYKNTRLTKIMLKPEKSTVDIGTITIEPSSTSLEAVEIVAERPQIEYKIDKKVISVDQNIVAAGGTAVDVLENTPSVQVDIEGNVSLRGSENFTVLIDGRPSVLKGNEALQQLPASAIQNIELITNPSAKYEAEGSAGIINIIMKKQKQQGVNGIVNSSVSTNGSYGGDILLNLRKNKINYILGGNYNIRTFNNTGYMERGIFNGDTTFYQVTSSEGAFHRDGYNIKGGIEYALDSKSSITLMGSYNNASFGRDAASNTHHYYVPSIAEDLYFGQSSDFRRTREAYELAADYLLRFNENGHQLAASLNYQDENSSEVNNLLQDTLNSTWQTTGLPQYREQTLENELETEFRAKVDYTLPISDKSRFEAGYQADFETSSEDYKFFNFSNILNEYVENTGMFNDKDFSEIVHSVYSTYSNGLGRIFDYQVGLRLEYNNRLLVQNITGERNEFNRWDLFPSLHISKQLPAKIQLLASYSRRIDRPGGRQLDPFKTYMDPYNVRMGNPALLPEYINSYEFNMQKSLKGVGFISLELFHRNTENLIDHYTIVDTLTNISYNTFKNINRDYSTGVEGMANIPLAKWWILNSSVSLYNYRLKGTVDEIDIDENTFSWNARFSSMFRLNTGTQFQLMGFYRAPTITTQGNREGFFFTNVGVRQDLFNKKLTLSLQVRDILGKAKFEFTSEGEGFSQYTRMKRQAQIVTFSVSYKINNYKQKERNVNGNGQNTNEMEFDSGDDY